MLETIANIPYLKEAGLVLAYGIIGGGIKYIDQAFDIGVFDSRIATIISIPTALLMGLLMITDPISATIFLALVLGLAVSRKIDNIAFQIGILTIILIPIILHNIVSIDWLPFGLLILACLTDEYTNDWSDKKQMERHVKTAMKRKVETPLHYQIAELIFDHRPVMKVTVLVLALAGQFPNLYFIAYFALDATYKLVEKISFMQKNYHLTEPIAQTKLSQLAAGRRGLSSI